jgi:branched-chain amino acid transport system permease protein
MTIFGLPVQALFGQLLLGIVNGSFYAMLSLGLSIIFGMLHIANFVHGAQYMMGAFLAWMALTWLGISYWWALLLVPIAMFGIGALIEVVFLRRLYDLDHFYGLLMTYGLLLMIESVFRNYFGSTGVPYDNPLPGGVSVGFMFLPYYRIWVVALSIVLCFGTWFAIERTRLGSYLRAATEKPEMVLAFGIDVPRLLTLTYAFGIALAGLAGVMAAPIQNVNPNMGSSLVIVIFAVVVIGGLGSIVGSILTGFALGIIEGLTKFFFAPAATTVIFVVMALVLLVRPNGLFGQGKT